MDRAAVRESRGLQCEEALARIHPAAAVADHAVGPVGARLQDPLAQVFGLPEPYVFSTRPESAERSGSTDARPRMRKGPRPRASPGGRSRVSFLRWPRPQGWRPFGSNASSVAPASWRASQARCRRYLLAVPSSYSGPRPAVPRSIVLDGRVRAPVQESEDAARSYRSSSPSGIAATRQRAAVTREQASGMPIGAAREPVGSARDGSPGCARR